MQGAVEQKGLECFVVRLFLLFLLDGHVVEGDGLDKILLQVVDRHLTAFLVDNFEIKRGPGQLQSVVGLGVHFPQCFEGFVVSEQEKIFSLQAGRKVLHAPDSHIHLEEVRRVVLIIGVKTAAGVGNGMEPPLVILLGQDGSKPTRLDAVSL